METNWTKVCVLLQDSATEELTTDNEICVLQKIEKNIYHKKPEESLKPIVFSTVSSLH